MFREKTFKGVKSGYSATTVSLKNYNVSYSTNTFLTDLFCSKLLEFLKECKVDCSYDTGTKVFKINKVPILFVCTLYTVSSKKMCFVQWRRAFNTTLISSIPTTATTIYQQSFLYNDSSGEYEISLRLCGEPKTFFWLIIKSFFYTRKATSSSSVTYTETSSWSPNAIFWFGKAKNLLRKEDVALFHATYGTTFFIYSFDENGDVINDLRSGSSNNIGFTFCPQFQANADEAKEFTGKLPLIPVMAQNGSGNPHFYMAKGLYQYVTGINLPTNGNNFAADSQTFITINGESFLITPGNNFLIKIETN